MTVKQLAGRTRPGGRRRHPDRARRHPSICLSRGRGQPGGQRPDARATPSRSPRCQAPPAGRCRSRRHDPLRPRPSTCAAPRRRVRLHRLRRPARHRHRPRNRRHHLRAGRPDGNRRHGVRAEDTAAATVAVLANDTDVDGDATHDRVR